MIVLFAASCFNDYSLFVGLWRYFCYWLAIMLMLLFFRPYGMARIAMLGRSLIWAPARE